MCVAIAGGMMIAASYSLAYEGATFSDTEGEEHNTHYTSHITQHTHYTAHTHVSHNTHITAHTHYTLHHTHYTTHTHMSHTHMSRNSYITLQNTTHNTHYTTLHYQFITIKQTHRQHNTSNVTKQLTTR